MKDQVDLLEATLASGEQTWNGRTQAREHRTGVRVDPDEQLRLESCSSEAIHLIDRVGAHGHVIAVRDGTVVVASERLSGWLGANLADVHEELAAMIATPAVDDDTHRLSILGEDCCFSIHRSTLVGEGVSNDELLVIEFEIVEGTADVSVVEISRAIHELSEVRGASESMEVAARVLRRITGYDRVLGYRFFEDGHGQVVADEHPEDMEGYLNLHFPASDIPAQARRLYLRKLSRMIVDTEDPGDALLQAGEGKLDLSLSELRLASSHHLQFMRNMGQRATLSLSLTYQGQLYGMITCAHRSPRRLPIAARRQLEVLARVIAEHVASERRVERMARQLETRTKMARILAPLYGDDPLEGILEQAKASIRSLIPCDAVFLRHEGEIYTLGSLPVLAEIEAALDVLGTDRIMTDSVTRDYPEVSKHLPGYEGLLVVPLVNDGDCLVFCRVAAAREVVWLGDQTASNRSTPLSPRSSFASWRESFQSQSVPWGEVAEDAYAFGDSVSLALRAREQARLAELAYEDPLTELPNRRFLEEHLDRLLHRGISRSSCESIAVIYIDVNDFKMTNDRFGHEVGDAVLMAVGERLTDVTRDGDIAVRLAGDEFVVICHDVSDEKARTIVEHLNRTLSEPVVTPTRTVSLSASVGMTIGREGDSAADVLSRADRAMYERKRVQKEQRHSE